MLHLYYTFYSSTVVANWFLNDSWPRRVHKSVAWSIDFCDQSHQSLADSRPENSRGDLPRGTETVLIGFDMQCQWITPLANQLQRDANMSGPRQPTNSQAKNSQGKMAWAAGKFEKKIERQITFNAAKWIVNQMSVGEFANNSKNVVSTKDRWQFLIAKDFHNSIRFVSLHFVWQTLNFSEISRI